MKLAEILNEYLVRSGEDLYDALMQLNLFVDMEKGNTLSQHDHEFAESEEWMAIEKEYTKTAKELEEQIKRVSGPITEDDVDAIHDVWYDGSDAYDSPADAIEDLVEIYDQQIELVHDLTADKPYGEDE